MQNPKFRVNQPVTWRDRYYDIDDFDTITEVEYANALANWDQDDLDAIAGAELVEEVGRGVIKACAYPSDEEIQLGVLPTWTYEVEIVDRQIVDRQIDGEFLDMDEGESWWMDEDQLSAILQSSKQEAGTLYREVLCAESLEAFQNYDSATPLPIHALHFLSTCQDSDELTRSRLNAFSMQIQSLSPPRSLPHE